MNCPVCFEYFPVKEDEHAAAAVVDENVVVLRKLVNCRHQCCSACLEKWFLQQESDLGVMPTCPECRMVVHHDDIQAVLGRQLRLAATAGNTPIPDEHTASDNDEYDDEEWIDEFTQVYLEEVGARACPSCGIWIIREEGCNNMMCRCGCRFCFCCGREGEGFGGMYYNNVLGIEEASNSDHSDESSDWDDGLEVDDDDRRDECDSEEHEDEESYNEESEVDDNDEGHDDSCAGSCWFVEPLFIGETWECNSEHEEEDSITGTFGTSPVSHLVEWRQERAVVTPEPLLEPFVLGEAQVVEDAEATAVGPPSLLGLSPLK